MPLARWNRAAAFLAALILGGLVVYQTGLFRSSAGATFDEPLYLDLGTSAWCTGAIPKIDIPTPGALPLLAANWLPALASGSGPFSPEETTELLYLSRLAAACLIGVPLVLLVFAWLTRRHGWLVGAAGGALVALSPSIVAHAGIAATDACFTLFALLALLALRWYMASPTGIRLVLLGAAIGLALGAKQSALFLFPVAGIVLTQTLTPASWSWRSAGGWVVRLAMHNLILGVVAVAVCTACYLFEFEPLLMPGSSHGYFERLFGENAFAATLAGACEHIYVPTALRSLLSQFGHGMEGHPAFLAGMRSSHGWWYYFPAAFALKSTPAEWFLAGAVLVFLCTGRSWRDPTVRVWLLAILVFSVLAAKSPLNIGQRYILVLYPLIVLVAVDGLATRWHRPRLLVAGTALLVVVQAASISAIAPHYLGYFNPLVGGPENGYRYLVDSNVDWGQDLPALRAELQRLDGQRVALAYFGSDTPAAYGIPSSHWRKASDAELADCDYLAISVTYLQGLYLRGDPFARFRSLPPVARAGYSILLYDLRDEEVALALSSAREGHAVRPAIAARE